MDSDSRQVKRIPTGGCAKAGRCHHECRPAEPWGRSPNQVFRRWVYSSRKKEVGSNVLSDICLRAFTALW